MKWLNQAYDWTIVGLDIKIEKKVIEKSNLVFKNI